MALNKQKLINGVRSRKPANEAEGICYDVLADDGWTLTKRGWPDYFAFKGDRSGSEEGHGAEPQA